MLTRAYGVELRPAVNFSTLYPSQNIDLIQQYNSIASAIHLLYRSEQQWLKGVVRRFYANNNL